MRKITIVLILGAFIATNAYFKANNLSVPQVTRVEQAKISDYQKGLDREIELKKKMQNPEIVRTALSKVGKITSLEGQYKYGSVITDKGIMNLTLRQMTLDLSFKFGIGMSNEYIKVSKIEGTTVFLKVPRNRLQLQYIQLNPESRIVDGKKMILVSQFNPSDVETLIEQSQQNVVNKIGTDKNLFDTAQINLQDELEKLVLGLGYYQDVMFDIV